jgi:hypothetical protein
VRECTMSTTSRGPTDWLALGQQATSQSPFTCQEARRRKTHARTTPRPYNRTLYRVISVCYVATYDGVRMGVGTQSPEAAPHVRDGIEDS